jgi:hypothetical protein
MPPRSDTSSIKSHLLVLVRNGVGFLPEFLCHHLRLFDKIHVIDHNSDFDLGVLNSDRVTVYRANIATYFQEEFINVLLEKVLKEEVADWIFILDVDEFLPFFSRTEFNTFLESYSSRKVIELSWRNGLPLDHLTQDDKKGVGNSKELLFHKDLSSTKKCAVNVGRMGRNVYIPRSNHRVQHKRNFFGFMPKYFVRVRGHDTGREIYHIVSSSLEDFGSKIQRFKDVRQKFMGVKGHGGSLILEYPDTYSIEDWLSFTANYRSGDPKHISRPGLSDFVHVDLFSSLDHSEIAATRTKLLSHPVASRSDATDEEQSVIDEKKKYGIKKRLFSNFIIVGSEININL